MGNRISDGDIERLLAPWLPHQAINDARTLAGGDPQAFLAAYRAELEAGGHSFPDLYDEIFYLQSNADVLAVALTGELACGLHHFIGWGIYEGRAPNARWADGFRNLPQALPPAAFDATAYLQAKDEAGRFLQAFPHLGVEEFARVFGSRLGHFLPVPPTSVKAAGATAAPMVPGTDGGLERLQLLRAFFDPVFYRDRYLGGDLATDPFDHYLSTGARTGLNPRADFDEVFYCALYPDIRQAISRGKLLSGFEHWLMAGQREGRLPEYDGGRVLEALAPGVTAPVALGQIDTLAQKIRPCPFSVDDSLAPRVWIVLPFLNPDLMFGGFASILAFIEELLARRVRIGLFLREAPAEQVAYFLYRTRKGGSRLARQMADIPVFSPRDGTTFAFGPGDLFVTYSVWDALWARHFAAATRWTRHVAWIQEYEPIFHKHDAVHFLAHSAYHHDHVGVFNSAHLKDYFAANRIGIYARPAVAKKAISYEHLLWHPGTVSRPSKSRSIRRTFLLYARPEEHAARNLFEIAVICLREAVAGGVFAGGWRFIGLGALAGPYRVDLGRGFTLDVLNRLPPEDYARMIATADVGMSLMHAPHPSLLPYELARAGAVVVTNTFHGRDAAAIRARSDNIIPFAPTIEDGVAAIATAVARVLSGTPTVPDSTTDRFPDSRTSSWGTIFGDDFFSRLALGIHPAFAWTAFSDPPAIPVATST